MQENKRIAFENYKRKHHLDDCYFFCSGRDRWLQLTITRNNKTAELLREDRYDNYFEITSVVTLVKFIKLMQRGECKVRIVDQSTWEHGISFEELKTNILIEKLSGLLKNEI